MIYMFEIAIRKMQNSSHSLGVHSSSVAASSTKHLERQKLGFEAGGQPPEASIKRIVILSLR